MKLKELLSRIPRPVTACISAVCVLLLAGIYYIVLGCPTLTFRQEFRRAEKANLVGPSTIVDTLDDSDYYDFNKMIVGETEYGVTFFGFTYSSRPNNNPFEDRRYVFSYQEKTGDVTVAVAPNFWGGLWGAINGTSDSLPVYIFTEYSDAVRAEVELIVSGSHSWTEDGVKKSSEFTETFSEKASAIEPGIFRCFLTFKTDNRGEAAYQLSNIVSRSGYGTADATITAMVWLYDEDGNIIVAQSVDIPSA